MSTLSREANPEKEFDLFRICTRNVIGVLFLECGSAGHAKDTTHGLSG